MLIKNIKLVRKKIGNQHSLFGTLTVETLNHGTFLFSTVENNSLRISSGSYPLGFAFSPRWSRDLLTVMDVPSRVGIRLHAANRGIELQGCIGIGLYQPDIDDSIPSQIYNSRQALANLESIIKTKTLITIEDDYLVTLINEKNERKNTNKVSNYSIA